MESFSAILIIALLAIIGLGIFIIYFIFKAIEFTLVSVNLYKKIVDRQEAMVEILIDIRDNTKKYSFTSIQHTDGIQGNSSSLSISENEALKTPESADELMKKYGIKFENEKYWFKNYSYDELKDAVNYAKQVKIG